MTANPSDIYIIDPLRTLHSADENDSAIEALLTEMQRVFRDSAVVLAHHMRKAANENACTLLQDMRTWSDGARGSSAIKAHTDVIVLQERTESENGDEVVYLGAFLKDGADIDPIALMETDHESYYWQIKACVPERLTSAVQALGGRKFKNKRDAARAIELGAKVARATAYRRLEDLLRLKLAAESETGELALAKQVVS